MKIVIRDCSKLTDHPIHVQRGRSMYECEEGREIYYLCPGGRLGDERIIRESDDIHALVEEVLSRSYDDDIHALVEEVLSRSYDDDEPPETWESIIEARNEARMEADLQRAEAAYERWIYGD